MNVHITGPNEKGEFYLTILDENNHVDNITVSTDFRIIVDDLLILHDPNTEIRTRKIKKKK